MREIAIIYFWFKKRLFKRPKSLISLEELGDKACIHLVFGAKTPEIGLYRALIQDSLLLRGDKLVRIGSRASKDVFWVVSGLEEIPFSVHVQIKWLKKIVACAPDCRVGVVLSRSRAGRKLTQHIRASSIALSI